MSANQCGFCASPLGAPVTLWGVQKVVCNNCLVFLARWQAEASNQTPKPPEWAKLLGKAVRYMSHDHECACSNEDEADCDCGKTEAFDALMTALESRQEEPK